MDESATAIEPLWPALGISSSSCCPECLGVLPGQACLDGFRVQMSFFTPHAMAGNPIQGAVHGYLQTLTARRYSVATVRTRQNALNSFACFLAATGVRDLAQVTGETIRAYQVWLTATAKCSVFTRYLRLVILRQFFGHLEDVGELPANPCSGVALPKLPQRLPRTVLTRRQARAVLVVPDPKTPKGVRDSAILELFYSTGIRLAEMAHLTVANLDLSQGVLRITTGKGGRGRVVPFGIIARERLQEYLQHVRPHWVKDGDAHQALWLSAIKPHPPLGCRAFYLIVRAAAKAAGIRHSVSPHVWRHTCATHLVASGCPIVCVQRILGHSSLNTTQIYTRVSVPELRRTFEQAHPRARERNAHVPDPIVG